MDALPKAVAILRVSDWIITYANAACERLYATAAGPGGIVGKPFTASQPKSGAEDFQSVIQAQLARGETEPVYEAERTRADGASVHVRVSVTPIEDPEHGPSWLAVVEDVTGLRQGEAALASANRELKLALSGSERRFKAISDAGMLGVVMGNLRDVVDVNDACTRMLGYTREEFVSQSITFAKLTPPEWQEVTQTALDRLQATGKVEPYRKELFHKNGTRVPVLITALRVDGGQALGLIIDLSAQQRAELALRATEEQLRQAQKMEAVGRLAGGVAHDFNNILSVILSSAEMLKEEHPDNDRMNADVDGIFHAARRGANLTRQLLLFSRQEVAQIKVFDLNEVLAHMRDMLERLVGEDIELVIAPAKKLGKVSADPGHIEQVVMNLTVNARDALPKGGSIHIATSRGKAADHSETVVFSLSDNGAGIDAATRARIFEPFFTTKERGKGSGLGLSTVLGIVQEAHGKVWVESEPGRGTTFTVELPAVPGGTAESIIPPPPSLLPKRATGTVLLVEDDPHVRRVARRILEMTGYRVVEATGPGDALMLFEQRGAEIDLVITDVVMPKLNGVDLIRKLRSQRSNVRTLCISGYTEDETARRGLQELRVPFLQKPFTPESLRRKVREALEQG